MATKRQTSDLRGVDRMKKQQIPKALDAIKSKQTDFEPSEMAAEVEVGASA